MSELKSEFECVGQIILISCDKIVSNKNHPRKFCDSEDLLKLSINIKANGLLLPISVRPVKYGRFEVISGERRLKAARLAGIKKIPAIIIDISLKNEILFSLCENNFRKKCNIFDEAEALKYLIDECSMTVSEIANQLGTDETNIINKINFLRFPRYVKIKITQFNLCEDHCNELLKINDEKELEMILEKVIKNNLNAVQTKNLIEKYYENKSISAESKKRLLLFKDIKLFSNTINHAVDTMQLSGIDAKSEKTETDDFIEYKVRIPKSTLFVIRSQ